MVIRKTISDMDSFFTFDFLSQYTFYGLTNKLTGGRRIYSQNFLKNSLFSADNINNCYL